MSASNSDAAIRRYVERMASIYSEIAEKTEDIKEIAIEAKAEGLNPEMIKRWARAIATEKESELAGKTIAQMNVGTIVKPELFEERPPEDEPAPPPSTSSARH